MATTKRKKPSAKGKPKAKGKAKAKAKVKVKAKVKKTAKPRRTAKPKKAARPKAARAAARRPAKTVKKSAARRPAKRVAPAAAPADTGTLAPIGEESSPATARSTTTLLQTIDLNAPPDEVYRAYTMAARHSEFTGGPAEIDARVGGRMTAWNGYIMGEFLHLEDGRRIVQTWRTTEWPDGYPDSKLELTFTPTESGTRVTMVHSSVPSEQARRYDDGWKENYWEPLKKYLSWESSEGESSAGSESSGMGS